MPESYHLTTDSLAHLFAKLRADGCRILAPVERDGRSELREVQTPAEVATDSLQTLLGAKETVFPRVERLLSFSLAAGPVQLEDIEPAAVPTVLFGIRPCEARAFRPLDAVFNWDTRDRFFNARMDALTVISVGCTRSDEACFCTSVGGSPLSRDGADLFLVPLDTGWYAEVLTERGEALRTLAPDSFQPGNGADLDALATRVTPRFDSNLLTARLPGMFDSAEWTTQSLRCVGCGACAYVCPTCVCFDIQEEADAAGGDRLRCWDTCGSRLFTLHASGHNPRELQSQRWRQRVYHKFAYYPDRYGMLGCVGCGRCTRACPVDMNLGEHLTHAAEVGA